MDSKSKKSGQKNYVCISCGYPAKELFKVFTPSVIKTAKCENCDSIVDKYIEFEPMITLVDAVLLSVNAYRHMLYNCSFKIHIKLSLVLLLLESFALWRQKEEDAAGKNAPRDFVDEKGFYICCLVNVIDNILLYAILLAFTVAISPIQNRIKFVISLYKATIIASFSKFFLLPILIWRENTTDFGASLHHLLVVGHYLLASVALYSIVAGLTKWHSAAVFIPVFFIKEYFKKYISLYIDSNL